MTLKTARKARNERQVDTAAKLGISLSLYEKVERGKMKPSGGFMRHYHAIFPTEDINSLFFTADSRNTAETE